MAATANAVRAGRAFVEIFVDDLGVANGLKRVNMRLRSWAATTSKIGLALIGAGTAIVAPLLLAGNAAASYGDNLNDAAVRTGLLVNEIAALTYAAELNGSSFDALEVGIKKMNVAVAGARGGSKEAIGTLAELGVSVADLNGLTANQQLRLFADRLARISDPGKRAAMAVKIFGKSGTDLLPMLAGGAAGLAAMEKQAEELGITLAADMASSVGDVDDLVGGLTQQFAALKTVVGVAVADGLRPFLQWAQPIVAMWIRWAAENQALVKTILLVGTGLIVVGTTLLGVGLGGTLLLTVFGLLLGAVASVVTAIATGFSTVIAPIGLLVGGIVSIVGAFAYLSGFGGDVLGYLGDLWGNLKTTALDAWGGIVAAVGAGDLALAGEIAWAGLKLGFSTVVAFLKQTWSSFKSHLLSVGFSAFYALQETWAEVCFAFGDTWTNVVKFIGDLWGGLKALLFAGWENTMDALENRWLDLIAFTTGANRDDLQKQADKDRAGRNKEISEGLKQADDERQKSFDAAQAARTAALEKSIKAIDAAARSGDKIAKDMNDAAQEAIAADLAKKKQELQDLRDEAMKKRDAAGNVQRPNGPQKPDFDADEFTRAAEVFKARGTFNSQAIGAMFAGGATNDIKRNTKLTVDELKKLRDQASRKKLGLAFA